MKTISVQFYLEVFVQIRNATHEVEVPNLRYEGPLVALHLCSQSASSSAFFAKQRTTYEATICQEFSGKKKPYDVPISAKLQSWHLENCTCWQYIYIYTYIHMCSVTRFFEGFLQQEKRIHPKKSNLTSQTGSLG